MGKILLTCALALVFGFGGAVGGIAVFHDSLRGDQGPTGLTGATGPTGLTGQDGADGVDGARGARGVRGKAGKDGKDAETEVAVDLGSRACAGTSVSVITDASVTGKQKLKLTRERVCIVAPTTGTRSASARAASSR